MGEITGSPSGIDWLAIVACALLIFAAGGATGAWILSWRLRRNGWKVRLWAEKGTTGDN